MPKNMRNEDWMPNIWKRGWMPKKCENESWMPKLCKRGWRVENVKTRLNAENLETRLRDDWLQMRKYRVNTCIGLHYDRQTMKVVKWKIFVCDNRGWAIIEARRSRQSRLDCYHYWLAAPIIIHVEEKQTVSRLGPAGKWRNGSRIRRSSIENKPGRGFFMASKWRQRKKIWRNNNMRLI